MELLFPPSKLTAHFRSSTSTTGFLPPSLYLPSSSSSSSASPLRRRLVSLPSAIRRIRCEFDAKINGALSGEFDPRFLDRVILSLSLLRKDFVVFVLVCSKFCFLFNHFKYILLLSEGIRGIPRFACLNVEILLLCIITLFVKEIFWFTEDLD